ncbi:unnamed protein product [Pleuronectes platessa]|uniref:Uncharacterized protein n=1 Tax=Pleuronectes platessa TaxID=8262 RepID=A0A9N7TG29_PLEPL|nr:unnamed protein product [Pleuronectes platessa]
MAWQWRGSERGRGEERGSGGGGESRGEAGALVVVLGGGSTRGRRCETPSAAAVAGASSLLSLVKLSGTPHFQPRRPRLAPRACPLDVPRCGEDPESQASDSRAPCQSG